MPTTEFKSPVPMPWTRPLLNDITKLGRGSGTTFVVKSGRQRSKTFTCILILLYYAINYPGTKNFFLSITQKMSRKVLKDLISLIGNSYDLLIKSCNNQTLEVELVNGSTIYFFSTEQGAALRGYTCSGVLIEDECSFYTPEVVELVQAWTNVYKPPVLMVSTPKFKRGYFFEHYSYGLQRIHKHISYDWSAVDTSQLLSEEQKEIYRQTMPKSVYTAEILGEFLDDSDKLFTGVSECIWNGTPVSNNIHIGIDIGGDGSDDTVLTSVTDKYEVVDLFELNNLTAVQQVDRMAEHITYLASKYKIVNIEIETNGLGQSVADFLQNKLKGYKITRHTTTNKSKQEEVLLLQSLFERGEIRIPNNTKLLSELDTYEGQYNYKTNTVSYNAANGSHDDYVMSMMIACDSVKNKNTRGSYNISFV